MKNRKTSIEGRKEGGKKMTLLHNECSGRHVKKGKCVGEKKHKFDFEL